MLRKQLIISIVLVIVVGVAAFFGGSAFGKAQMKSSATGNKGGSMYTFGGGSGRARAGMGNGNGGFVSGQILKADSNSITVQMPNNGGSKIVYLSSSSQISKSVAGSVSDLTVGENVVVTGTSSADGSITAQNIQIRPAQNQNTSGSASSSN